MSEKRSDHYIDALHEAVEGLDHALSVFDNQLCLVYGNQRFRELLDLPAALCESGTRFADIVRYNARRGEYGDEPVDNIVAHTVELAKQNVAHSFQRKRPNGVWLEVSGRPLPSGGFATTYADITERKKAEKELYDARDHLEQSVRERTSELQEREAELNRQKLLLETTISSVTQGVTLFDPDLNLAISNSHVLELLDLPERFSEPGTSLVDIFRYNAERGEYGEGDVEEQVAERAALAKKLLPHSFIRTRPDGRLIEVVGRPAPGVGFVTTYTDVTERERTAMEERALADLARLSLTTGPLNDYLKEVVSSLLSSVSWLGLLPRGGVFLTSRKGRGDELSMAASINLDERLTTLCRRVAFGCCLCGRAASTREVQHSHCLDERHDIRYEGMTEHGHYSVPILGQGRVLGVLVLYLPHGHVDDESQRRFLKRVGNVLSLGILRKYAEEQADYLAYYDSLTGLPNRRLLLDRLSQALHEATRDRMKLAVIYLDLDHFKNINDALGHSAGDQLLEHVAERLRVSLREPDTIARLGGDEFVVVLPHLKGDLEPVSAEVAMVANKLRNEISTPVLLEDHRLHEANCSIGVALFPEDGDEAEELLQKADTAMYNAKKEERGSIHFFRQEMQETVEYHLSLGKELRTALAEEAFLLHYHPLVDVQGNVVGAEALVRWNHPERGFVSPDIFIPIAEETGLIVELGEWVFHEVCRQIRAWENQGLATMVKRVTVNMSARQLRQENLFERLQGILRETGVSPARLGLEITETALVENIREVVGKIEAIRNMGLSFSIDDFGTGYSSLAYLKRLPLDVLKIDRSFVQDVTRDGSDAAIVQSIIAMASHLSLDVVAEGVETVEQLDFLRQCGCRRFQGYYFSKPLPADQFVELCRDDARVVHS